MLKQTIENTISLVIVGYYGDQVRIAIMKKSKD